MAIRLYKRPDSAYWWFSFTTPDGKHLRRSTGTEDETLAQEIAAKQHHESLRVQRLGEKPRHTWEEAVVYWFAQKHHRVYCERMQTVLRVLDPVLAGKYLDEITSETIADITIRRRSGALSTTDKPPKGAAVATVNRTLAFIRGVLRMAVAIGWLDRVPLIRLAPELPRVRWITPEEAERLIQELPQHLSWMVRFTLATGLRESNILTLKWANIDLDRRLAWIDAINAKGRRAIGIPLNDTALAVLAQCRGRHADYVFVLRGRPIHKAGCTAWRSALKRAGIESFRWHDLRHTWASWHVQNGTPLHILKELGGWRSYGMVLRYAHLGVEHLAPYADRLPNVIKT